MSICNSRVAAIAAIGAMTFAATPTLAKPGNGADVSIDEVACTGAVPNENGTFSAASMLVGVETKVQRVSTPSGNMLIMCKFDVPASMTPDSKRSAKGFGCTNSDTGQRTTETQMLVSPGGRGTLICKF